MSARLENLTGRPVVLVLASGDALRLSPGEVSDDMADVEVAGSAKVQELVAGGVVAVHRETAARPAVKRGRKAVAK